MTMDLSCFKAYDLRGRVPDQLNPQLAERIGRNGRLHDNERALVKFIEQSSPSIHPDLRTLLEKVA